MSSREKIGHNHTRPLLFWALLSLLAACGDTQGYARFTCEPVPSQNGNIRKVFSDCRTFLYKARYWDDEYNLLSSEWIAVTATGRPWEQQPDLQDEIIIQYERGPSLRDKLLAHSINPEVDLWSKQEVTGIIEDGRRLWMHPFRSNQYVFTEVAGFPEVQLPVQAGAKWSTTLSIQDGWGAWEHSSLSTLYKVLGTENIDLPFGQLSAWHIRAVATADFGQTRHDYWYHEDYGFMKMVIKNYAGQLLVFELAEVIDWE